MIRIDEIYTNTICAWIKKHKPHLRIFYCDPFGRSDPESVISANRYKKLNTNYVFFFDQEPIHLDLHIPTFDKLSKWSNSDLYNSIQQTKNYNSTTSTHLGYLVTSEKNSDNVDIICKKYGWKSYYYFFHGWAALDWYRGYNKTYLISNTKERTITKTFIMPNRIVAGKRQHRLIMLYYIFKNKLFNNWISCPSICPAENINVLDEVSKLINQYPDIVDIFKQQQLPIDFPNESGHPMKSCWLDLFDESSNCLLYLVTETVATGRRLHLTEKTFKPICLRMPFIIIGTQGSLSYLRSYGFKTFEGIWDESYDNEVDDVLRLERIASLLRSLDELSNEGKQDLFNMAQEIVEHNYNHFYSGAFEEILWTEFNSMLEAIDV
jgi:hypothetical protein